MQVPVKMGCLFVWIVRKIQWSVGLKKNLSSVTDGSSQEDRVHSSCSYKQIYSCFSSLAHARPFFTS